MVENMKKTPPPFDNLMTYETMKTIKPTIADKTAETTIDSKCSKNTVMSTSVSTEKRVSCYDKMKSHSGLVSSVSDNTIGHRRSAGNLDGCYSARKVVIDRADSLVTFLNEAGSDNGDSCNSTDSDSLGDEGYLTDSHNPCPLTNLSSSSSSLVSSDGELTPVTTKPGILKRFAEQKATSRRKKVTFMSLPCKKRRSVGDSPSATTLEQKIMALAIINEENELENYRAVGKNDARSSNGLTAAKQPVTRLHDNVVSTEERVRLAAAVQGRLECPAATSKQGDDAAPLIRTNSRVESNYVNIPATRSDCIAFLRGSRLPGDGVALPPGYRNQRMSRNSIACPYITGTRSRVDDEVTVMSPPGSVKQCVARTMSNTITVKTTCGSNFASSSEILKLFQTNVRSFPVDKTLVSDQHRPVIPANSSPISKSKSRESTNLSSNHVSNVSDPVNIHDQSNHHAGLESTISNTRHADLKPNNRPQSTDPSITNNHANVAQAGILRSKPKTKTPLYRLSSLPVNDSLRESRENELLPSTRLDFIQRLPPARVKSAKLSTLV